MGLLYVLALWSNVYVIWALDPMVVCGWCNLNARHYRVDIISDVGHPKSDSVVLLVLCTITCNGWGTIIVLQVP
jgi:hypothetical protein